MPATWLIIHETKPILANACAGLGLDGSVRIREVRTSAELADSLLESVWAPVIILDYDLPEAQLQTDLVYCRSHFRFDETGDQPWNRSETCAPRQSRILNGSSQVIVADRTGTMSDADRWTLLELGVVCLNLALHPTGLCGTLARMINSSQRDFATASPQLLVDH